MDGNPIHFSCFDKLLITPKYLFPRVVLAARVSRTGPNYYATLARTKNYLAGGQASTECKRAIDYYAFAVKYRDASDAFGDDVLEDAWSLWASYTPDPPVLNLHSPIALGKDGAGDYPTPWCNEPTAADPNKGHGYSVTGFFIIVRWNITGGFEYVAG